MSDRPFRRDESYKAEKITREMLPKFLEDRGYSGVRSHPDRNGQTIVAVVPGDQGQQIKMRVRLCWRRETGKRDSERVRTYSAAQLLAKIKDDDWEGSLNAKVKREQAHKVTHLLIVQRDDEEIKYAALVPLEALVPIWALQRDISKRLIDGGRLGRRKKNHAMNGTSPTLWLQDDRGGQEVAAALWNFKGVRDLAKLPRISVPVLSEGVVEPTRRGEVTTSRIIRSSALIERVKAVHGNRCQVCGLAIEVPGGLYSEGAHMHPLGEPHNGPDVIGNILCLCPNHHVMLDRRAFSINDDWTLIGCVEGRLRTHPDHLVSLEHVRFHRTQIYNTPPG
jgi:5-methylcytosine-specific restriction protein A